MFLALLLIVLGGLLLLVNLGVVGADVWWALLRLWPVALIAIGLDLAIGRRSTAARVGVAGVTLAVLAVGLVALTTGAVPATTVAERTTIAHEVADAERGQVRLDAGVGRLSLSTTDDEAVLLAGSVTAPSRSTVVDEREDVAETARIRIAIEGGGGWSPIATWRPRDGPAWDLRLGAAIPVDLTVDTGVGESELDLRDAWLERLVVDGGVGRTTVTLPASGDLTAEINGGVGELRVRIPDGVAVAIAAETGVGAMEIDGPWDADGDGVWRSAGWDTAEDRVELVVRAGVGRVEVRQADRR